MNRRQRRAMKNQPKRFSESDMRRAAREAAQTTASHSTEMILAALCLALHGEFGFGQRRCVRVLERIEQITLEALCAGELVDRVKDCMGVEIGKLESL